MSSELPEELEGIEEELELDEPEPFEEETETETEPEDDSEPERREQFVICAVGEDRVAVHVDAVQRIVDLTDITRVPRTSDAIDGITDLRGEITAVIDPRVLFDVGPIAEPSEEQDVVVFQLGREEGNSGLRIDDVADVRPIPVSRLLLDPSETTADSEEVERLLDSDLYAGVIEDPNPDGTVEYVPIVDVDSLVDASKARVAA